MKEELSRCATNFLNWNEIVPFLVPAIVDLTESLPAAWLAGFTVAALIGVGAAVKFILAGEISSLPSLFAGLLFIPSLALVLGVWTGSSKAFEVLYALFWYLGLLNKVLELDYIGIHTTEHWTIYTCF